MIIISVLEINLLSLAKNMHYYKNKLKYNQKFCFVVKSNCYGLGDEICRYFNDFVDYFAVSSWYEFSEIKNKISKPVLILDPIYDSIDLKKLIKNKCELTISNLYSFELISKISKQFNMDISVHIAINSGMNRFGFKDINEVEKVIDDIKKSQNIKIKGIFSHYFDAKNDYFAKYQIKQLKYYMSLFEGKFEKYPMVHMVASDGLLYNNFGDLARVGYGIYSDNKDNQTITLKTKILEIQNLNNGDSAGYSSCYIADKNCKIAVIGIGYGDGIMRSIVNDGYVIINGEYSKILAICMDSMIVDINDINCKINDDSVIIGKMGNVSISICDIANWCGTIGYEVITRISQRVRRIYKGKDKCRLFLEGSEQENLSLSIVVEQDQPLQG